MGDCGTLWGPESPAEMAITRLVREPVLKNKMGAWRDASVAEKTYCSCRGLQCQRMEAMLKTLTGPHALNMSSVLPRPKSHCNPCLQFISSHITQALSAEGFRGDPGRTPRQCQHSHEDQSYKSTHYHACSLSCRCTNPTILSRLSEHPPLAPRGLTPGKLIILQNV